MFNPEELAYKEPERRKFRLPSLPKLPKLPRLPRLSRPGKRGRIIIGGLIGVVLLAGGWFSYQNLQRQFNPATEEVQSNTPPQQVLGLIEQVENKGTELPDNEYPSVATISDLSKLSDQAFFNGAAIGDKVLIYAVAKKAVIYRPSTNEVIRASRVEIADDPESASTASESAVLSASDSAEPVLRIKF